MTILAALIARGAPGILDDAGHLARGFMSDKTEQESDEPSGNIEIHRPYAMELQNFYIRTWFDRAIDGLNRLARPSIIFGVIALFIWCIVSPSEFSIRMKALDLIPQSLWIVIGTVVTFLFGSRSILDARKAGKIAISSDCFNEMLRNQAALKNDSRLLSNSVIEDWNRRNQTGR